MAPSMVIDLEPPKPTAAPPNIIEIEVGSSSMDALINRSIIKVDKYRTNKATRRVIAHVHFEPD